MNRLSYIFKKKFLDNREFSFVIDTCLKKTIKIILDYINKEFKPSTHNMNVVTYPQEENA